MTFGQVYSSNDRANSQGKQSSFALNRSLLTILMQMQGKGVGGNLIFRLWLLLGPAKVILFKVQPRLQGLKVEPSCAPLLAVILRTYMSLCDLIGKWAQKRIQVFLELWPCVNFILSPYQVRFLYSFNKNVLGIYNVQASFESAIKIANAFFFCLFHFILKPLY